jgi:hypothetical protein
VIRRTLRLHQNGRTLLSWWAANGDYVTLPLGNYPGERFEIRFETPHASLVLLNHVPLYHFAEVVEPPPPNAFHKIEFLFDNSMWVVEYRREQDG